MKTKHGLFFSFVVLLVAAIFSLAGCDNGTTSGGNNNGNNGNNSSGDGGGLSGTWGGTVSSYSVTVVITASGWTLSSSANFSDYGTYTINGISASLYSTRYSLTTGTATLIDSNTISVSLNSSSVAPGTHTLTRR